MSFIVRTPQSDFTGAVGADRFVDGLCESPSESQRAYYERHGYTITDSGEADTPSDSGEADTPSAPDGGDANDQDQDPGPEKPKSNAPKAEVEAYAQHLGIDTDGKSKEALWDAIAAHEGDHE